ncbi:bifunctional phosphopantothenoylcysteine decarboxylase/phosphopantothenate--cysteine ligase CoaBC [Riemerella anatipestifer]|nr:bifunctional phosphopantothenoylcysteine decarboxylase/phosphopantothenate--cysteine ligase CoaBC [Riemerella anatipestifer]
MILNNKKILIAISGGIAAYKINLLVRDFIKAGADVKVILTPSAEKFVSKLTLATLSKNEVLSELISEDEKWNNHVELGLWADAMIIAPCTANTLAKMVHGICDNLVVATYLSAKCPVFIAPAMDLDMYQHPSTKRNLDLATTFGNHIIPAEEGELASGLVGIGRLAEPCTIFNHIHQYFENQNSASKFNQKKVLITAGPTYEAIDPVRFIGNHSSGKMGYALAETAAQRGAKVILISGPSNEIAHHPDIELHSVTSAKEMYQEVFKHYNNVDIAIASAAVADYTPKVVASEKIKKQEEQFTIELVKNPDILKTMGEQKKHQILVGFALETQNEEENAKAKLEKKNLDMIVLNSLKDSGAGFKKDTNKVSIITSNSTSSFDLKSKKEVANDILDFIENQLI